MSLSEAIAVERWTPASRTAVGVVVLLAIALAFGPGCWRANVPASSGSAKSGAVSASSQSSVAGTASCTSRTTSSPLACMIPRLRVRP